MMKNKNISNGDKSTNIGKAENVEINYSSQEPQVINYKKKTIGNINTSPRNITILGVLGFSATIITNLSVFVKFPITEIPSIVKFLPFFMIGFVFLLMISLRLNKRQFIPFFGKYSLESDSERIYLKRTKLSCPQCSSGMKVFQNNYGVIAACVRNPEQHRYNFDYTTFEDNE